MPLFDQVTIVGVGLIGGSLAKAIKEKRIAKRIVGFFRSEKKLKRAIKEKIVDRGFLNLRDSIENSELIILALPVNQIIRFLPQIKKISKNNVILTDAGSTKSIIVSVAEKLNLNFVGSHPLAGSEKSGLEFSSSKLFNNSLVLVTPTNQTNKLSLKKIKMLWMNLNTRIVILNPKLHDKILAYTSHLPHLISFSLINSIPNKYLTFSGPGLKDATRIALSEANIWSDILLTNKTGVLQSLKSFEKEIKIIKSLISKNKTKQLGKFLDKSKNKRQNIN